MHRRTVIANVLVLASAASSIPACAPYRAAATISTQSHDNARSLTANAHALADLAAAQSAALSRIRLHHAGQQSAIALVRLLAAPKPDIAARIDSLRATLEAAPAAQRDAVLAALARREPALIDAAAAAPGFDIDRLLRDAASLDALHIQLESERDPALRTALFARRDALLEPLALVRGAHAAAAVDLAALQDLRAVLDEQSRVLLLHTRMLADFSDSAAAPSAAAIDLHRSAELRTLLLDSVERARGRESRDRIADWLDRSDSAIDIVIND